MVFGRSVGPEHITLETDRQPCELLVLTLNTLCQKRICLQSQIGGVVNMQQSQGQFTAPTQRCASIHRTHKKANRQQDVPGCSEARSAGGGLRPNKDPR